MKQSRWTFKLIALGLVIAAITGCGGTPAVQPVELDQIANAKVEATKKLADAMAKNPNSGDMRAALEEFRMNMLDVKKNPKEAQELIDIYRQRIKGKYRGELADEVQSEMSPIEIALKALK